MGIRVHAAWLALVLTPVFAQQGVTVRQINPDNTVTQTSFTFGAPGGPTANSPAPGPNNTFKYWDVGGLNYVNQPPYITQPRQPQVAAGPNDIFTVVNDKIAHYANPNAAGNTGAANPIINPATDTAEMASWLGFPAITALCPSGGSFNCVIDNISIRYDQMQGRFVVLFTATDVPAHRSNFVLIVSKLSQFTKCPSPPTAICPAITPVFTQPVAGGNPGGAASALWFYYMIPVNLAYATQPTVLGNGVAGTATTVTTGGHAGIPFVSTPFCPNGGPSLPVTGANQRTCTNYFPTGARMGIDNDNITLVAPVLDQMNNNAPEGTIPFFSGTGADSLPLSMGPYAGTRVVTVPKLAIYNALAPAMIQPPACDPASCGIVNLSDNVATGTLTEVPGCNVNSPLAACAPQGPANSRTQPIRAIFWEPDNLRGRALASFDSQVAPLTNGNIAGDVTQLEYLVGHQVFSNAAAVIDSNQIFLQPIVFSCPNAALQGGLPYCGVTGAGLLPDQPVLAPLQSSAATLASMVTNSDLVGQGLSAASQVANDGTPEANNRLFVGDSRPAQVLFREGLLYEARSVRPFDSSANPLGSSTVQYDILRNCPGGSGPSCAYSADGSALTAARLAQEDSWFNGDAAGNAAGFGFYAPMFDATADVVTNDPASSVNVFPWLQKLFVGMTTGGPANTVGAFSKNFASLWAYRPGDDAFDTVEPYINPYTGAIDTFYTCGVITGKTGTLTNGSRTITAVDTSGIVFGMAISGAGIPAGSVMFTSTPGVAGTITWTTATGGATVTGGNTCTNGINPGTGAGACVATNVALTFTSFCPVIPWSKGGGASTDPNDGSLWLYGAFAKQRLATIPGPGQWATAIANYALGLPASPATSDDTYFSDVQPGNAYFTWIQIAKNLNLAQPTGSPAGKSGNTVPPPAACEHAPAFTPPGQKCRQFNLTDTITRAEAASWVVRAQMDETAVTNFLCGTGGDPSGMAACPGVPGGTGVSTFGDLGSAGSKINNPFQQASLPGFQVITSAMLMRYIEVMARRGYAHDQTSACLVGNTKNVQHRFCPNDPVTRAQLAGFMIRAKMGNVFPTSLLGGAMVSPASSDILGTMQTPFFTDVKSTDDFFLYVQEMRELGILNGTGTQYSPNSPVPRQEVALVIVRAFFL